MLAVLLIGAIAGVITHVPAGLGVLEFVFVALLSHRVSEGQLLGALLAYRAIYYIVPLMVAAVLYLVMEAHARQRRRSCEAPMTGKPLRRSSRCRATPSPAMTPKGA